MNCLQMNFYPSDVMANVRKNMPNEYIRNEVLFCGFKFYVDNRTYISDTDAELLAQEGIKITKNSHANPVVIDVGCGCGSIGLTIALLNKKVKHLLLTDISKSAIEVARINYKQLHSEKNLLISTTFLESDLLKSIPDNIKYNNSSINLRNEYIVVVCSPPYGSIKDTKFYSQNLKKKFGYVPSESLWRPHNKKFEIHQRLLKEFKNRHWNGKVLIECGRYSKSHFKGLFPKTLKWQHRWLAPEYAIIECDVD